MRTDVVKTTLLRMVEDAIAKKAAARAAAAAASAAAPTAASGSNTVKPPYFASPVKSSFDMTAIADGTAAPAQVPSTAGAKNQVCLDAAGAARTTPDTLQHARHTGYATVCMPYQVCDSMHTTGDMLQPACSCPC